MAGNHDFILVKVIRAFRKIEERQELRILDVFPKNAIMLFF